MPNTPAPTAPTETKTETTPEEDYEQLGFFSRYLEKHEDDRKRALLVRPGRHPSTRPTELELPGMPPSPEQIRISLEAATDSNLRDLNLTAMRQARVTQWVFKRQENTDERLEQVLQAQKDRPNRRELWIVLGGVWLVGLILGVVVGVVGLAIVGS